MSRVSGRDKNTALTKGLGQQRVQRFLLIDPVTLSVKLKFVGKLVSRFPHFRVPPHREESGGGNPRNSLAAFIRGVLSVSSS
ncbi:hypothetical protein CEXT_122041 [Caerostris extrusa]|uniref:Uncharacterized protein n=1 Tax=Caerostris extrusa TaxID=172846 RepID=A0AAV4W003_CAEEX|nr:hypothetical protein CEXT_122041 [Caerostris extrusa]